MDDIDVVIAFASSPAKLVLSVRSAGFVSISGEKRGRVGEKAGLNDYDDIHFVRRPCCCQSAKSLSSIHG